MTQELISFAQLELASPLLRTLDELNFANPSPIQEQSIPWLLQGRDLIGQAQTGTGKTAAFSLPILQGIQLNTLSPQALILAPTRELAIQVAVHCEDLARHMPGIRIVVLCGGQDYRPQLKSLREGAHIVVGTPGRILDHMDKGTLKLEHLRTFVLDEADEMLRMGFIEDVETILAKLPETKQMVLFSATMPHRIGQIAKRYLRDPISVKIQADTATVKSIEQRFLFASQGQKQDALIRVLAFESCQGVIVFVRTKSSTEEVAQGLQEQGYRAMALHGDISQNIRERIITQFRQGAIDILVATDVAARGLDVDRVTHVINFDMAHDCETYVHRIGRTGRAGRSGVTVLFVTPRESRMLQTIERHTRQRITKIQVPDDVMIQSAKEKRFVEKITERLQHQHLPAYRQMIEEYMKEHEVLPLDIAAALALLLNQDQPRKQEVSARAVTPPRIAKEERRSKREEKKHVPLRDARNGKSSRGRKEEYPQELFRLNVGRVHGVKAGNIVGAIANEGGLQSCYIQGIKINDDHSLVRLPQGITKEVFHDLNKARVCGRPLKLTSLGAL